MAVLRELSSLAVSGKGVALFSKINFIKLALSLIFLLMLRNMNRGHDILHRARVCALMIRFNFHPFFSFIQIFLCHWRKEQWTLVLRLLQIFIMIISVGELKVVALSPVLLPSPIWGRVRVGAVSYYYMRVNPFLTLGPLNSCFACLDQVLLAQGAFFKEPSRPFIQADMLRGPDQRWTLIGEAFQVGLMGINFWLHIERIVQDALINFWTAQGLFFNGRLNVVAPQRIYVISNYT